MALWNEEVKLVLQHVTCFDETVEKCLHLHTLVRQDSVLKIHFK